MRLWTLVSITAFICGGCADQMLLYPSTQPIDPAGAGRRIFNVGAKKIEVFVARSAAATNAELPDAYVLEFCGNATRAERVAYRSAQLWDSRSVEIWAMNYPGFGQSDGPASVRALPDAALAVFDQLSKAAQGRPIFVSGRSIGTTIALCVAARRPVAGVVLHSAVPLRPLIMGRFGWWNLWIGSSIVALGVPDEMGSIENAGRTKAPAVFIISGADELVPPEYQMRVFDAYAGSKHRIVLKDAGHNSAIEPEDEVRLQSELDWLLAQVVR